MHYAFLADVLDFLDKLAYAGNVIFALAAFYEILRLQVVLQFVLVELYASFLDFLKELFHLDYLAVVPDVLVKNLFEFLQIFFLFFRRVEISVLFAFPDPENLVLAFCAFENYFLSMILRRYLAISL